MSNGYTKFNYFRFFVCKYFTAFNSSIGDSNISINGGT